MKKDLAISSKINYTTHMTTVAQFIAHLQSLPQDAIIQCLVEKSCAYETWTSWTDLEIDRHVYLCGNRIEIGEK